MQTPRSTVCLGMMVKNEAPIIRRALLSALPWIDTWLITDTGSSDGTQQIIRETLQGIPGELVEIPWQDYGHNRSEVLRLARGRADYTLFLDADLVLEVPGEFRDRLGADAYDLRYRGSLDYVNIRLFHSRHPWRYVGVTHEYPWSDAAWCGMELPDVRLIDYSDGANRVDKFQRDIRLLTGSVEQNPANARDTFYLARSYEDLGDFGPALFWYERRAAMVHGWEEERWYAKFKKALMMDRIGVRTGQVQEAYLAAYAARPSRFEPLFFLIKHLHDAGESSLALVYASHWMFGFPYPKEDRLFIDATVYAWRMDFAVWALASETGRKDLMERQRNILMERPDIPAWIKTALA